MSRSPAKSGNAIATKSLKEKWLSIVQSAREKGEKGIGGSSTVTSMGDPQFAVVAVHGGQSFSDDWILG